MKSLYDICCVYIMDNEIRIDGLPKLTQHKIVTIGGYYKRCEFIIIYYNLRRIHICDILTTILDELDWMLISVTRFKLTDGFIQRYSDRLFWYYISEYQTLSEQLIEENLHKIDWYNICRYQHLSKKFIKKYINNLSGPLIYYHQPHLSKKFRLHCYNAKQNKCQIL